MKTPMQELIDNLDIRFKNTTNQRERYVYNEIINLITSEYLEKEKQMVIDAYLLGQLNGKQSKISSEQYYNETFKQ